MLMRWLFLQMKLLPTHSQPLLSLFKLPKRGSLEHLWKSVLSQVRITLHSGVQVFERWYWPPLKWARELGHFPDSTKTVVLRLSHFLSVLCPRITEELLHHVSLLPRSPAFWTHGGGCSVGTVGDCHRFSHCPGCHLEAGESLEPLEQEQLPLSVFGPEKGLGNLHGVVEYVRYICGEQSCYINVYRYMCGGLC